MKIIKYRTVAVAYPHLSLEAMIELDNGDIVYTNISVNDKGEEETYYEDNHWTYTKPLTEIDWDNVEDYYYDLTSEETERIHIELLKIWNLNLVFDNNREWKEYTDAFTISGIIFRHGTDDYEFWAGFTLSKEDEDTIMSIFSKYDTEGCSVRGTQKEIVEEIGG